MNFVNETKMEAGWMLGFEPNGRELLVVAVKGTFHIPKEDEEAVLEEEQIPLTEADEFTGEVGLSATMYESDYAHRKSNCDILLNGSAYAPDGRPATSVRVLMYIETITKYFNVVGDRIWDKSFLSLSPTPRKPFVKMPITYDRAYGGVDTHPDKPEKIKTYTKNPVGVGYYPYAYGKHLQGKPLPNTEEHGKPIKKKNGNYRPMSFGPISRNFEPRLPFVGTYDKQWMENQAPFWPDDFNDLYFQAAPPDQQIPYPKGGEKVVLYNLSPEGCLKFQIPKVRMPILFAPYKGEDIIKEAVIDTVLFEPDNQRFMLTWRASLPLRKNCFELREIIAGELSRSWYRRRKAAAKGKACYAGINAYIKAKNTLFK